MTTKVERTIVVDVPVRVAYDQWTQFEEFPQFMGGVKEVRQLDDQHLRWVAEIAGVQREWRARILEQLPDEKVAWAATEGATNAGAVTFTPVGPDRTTVTLSLEYEPEGLVEKVGDKLHLVEKEAEGDLDRFKAFIEGRRHETGAWRGTIDEGGVEGTPGVESAALSRGDDGKAGVSGKVVAAGAAAAAAGVAAAAATRSGSERDVEGADVEEVVVEEVVVEEPAPEERAVEERAAEPLHAPDGPLSAGRQAGAVVDDERHLNPGMSGAGQNPDGATIDDEARRAEGP